MNPFDIYIDHFLIETIYAPTLLPKKKKKGKEKVSHFILSFLDCAFLNLGETSLGQNKTFRLYEISTLIDVIICVEFNCL